VPSGRVEWFIKGALRVGGIAGGGYVGIVVSTVLERLGISVGRTTEVELVLKPGSVGRGPVDVEEGGAVDDVFWSCVVVEVVSRADVVVFCCAGGLEVVVAAGALSPLSVVVLSPSLLLLLLSSFFWATTPRAKKVVRSKARFRERGEDPMTADVCRWRATARRNGRELMRGGGFEIVGCPDTCNGGPATEYGV